MKCFQCTFAVLESFLKKINVIKLKQGQEFAVIVVSRLLTYYL